MADVGRFAGQGRYVNDVAESHRDAISVYGEGKYERLIGLKRVWGPVLGFSRPAPLGSRPWGVTKGKAIP